MFKRKNPYRILLVTLETVVCIAIISGAFLGINTLLRIDSTPIEYAITVAYFAIFLHFADKEDSYE